MLRVLVVDDQAEVRTIISIVLRMNRFEIVEAATAASALKLFEQAASTLRSSTSFCRTPMART